MKHNKEQLIKKLLASFIVILFLSGLTAIPIDDELSYISSLLPTQSLLHQWLLKVLLSYRGVKEAYPFLLYGYDWLAFAHFVLAILFIGPYQNPVKNIWIIRFGLIACTLIIPFALIAGSFRRIPFWWRLIDCSFGVIGFAVLWFCYKKIQGLLLLSAYSTKNLQL